MLRKLISAAGILIFSLVSLFSQSFTVADSLEIVVKTTKIDSLKVIALNDLFWEYCFTNPEKARPYAEKSLIIAQEIKYRKGEASALNSLGVYADEKGNYKDALDYYEKAARIFESLQRYKSLSVVYANIAIIYKMLGNFNSAMDYNFKALAIKEKIGDEFDIADSYNNIGSLFAMMNNLRKSLEYNNKALHIRRKVKDERGTGYSLNNIADVYREHHDYRKAIRFYTEALQVFTKISDDVGIASTYSSLGLIYQELKDFSQAVKNQEMALQIILRTGIKERIAHVYHNLGTLYFSMGDIIRSKENFQKCFNTAQEIGHLDMMYQTSQHLSRLAAQQRNFSEAYRYNSIHCLLQDSLFNIEKNKQLTELEIRYESEKKDGQIKLLNQKTRVQQLELAKRMQWIVFSMIFIFLLTVIFVLIHWFRNFRHKQLLLQTVLETENAERMRIAKDMHDELGSGFSKIQLFSEIARQNITNEPVLNENLLRISNSSKELVNNMRDLIWTLNPVNATLDNLVARLREYSADFLDEFSINYEFNFPEEIPTVRLQNHVQRNVYLTLKEALNNAVKHAGAKTLEITLKVSDKIMFVQIKDDGKGFEPEGCTKGNGLKNMMERISCIGGTLNIESKNGKGTSVKFSVDLIQSYIPQK